MMPVSITNTNSLQAILSKESRPDTFAIHHTVTKLKNKNQETNKTGETEDKNG
jgi:hypothetical protein